MQGVLTMPAPPPTTDEDGIEKRSTKASRYCKKKMMEATTSQGDVNGKLHLCCRPLSCKTPSDTFIGLLGYCRKERHLPSFAFFARNITHDMEEAADDMQAKYGAGKSRTPNQNWMVILTH